jgi:hypothetical protein
MSKIDQVVMITPIITTTLKYPAAVGEARTVEPHEEGLDPGKAGEHRHPPVRVESLVDKT